MYVKNNTHQDSKHFSFNSLIDGYSLTVQEGIMFFIQNIICITITTNNNSWCFYSFIIIIILGWNMFSWDSLNGPRWSKAFLLPTKQFPKVHVLYSVDGYDGIMQ